MFPLIKGSISLLLLKFAFLGMRVIALLTVAKFGSAADLASIAFAIAMGELGRLIADFGTDTASVRLLVMAQSTEQRSKTVGTVAAIKLVGSLIVWPALIVACVHSFGTSGYALALAAGLLMLTAQCGGIATAFFQAEDRIGELCRSVLPCALAAAIIVAGTAANTGNALLTLAVLIICEVTLAMLLMYLLRREGVLTTVRNCTAGLRTVVTSSAPYAAFGLVVGLYSRLDTLVLAQFSMAALATYTVAQRLYQPLQTAATIFGAVVYRKVTFAIAERQNFSRTLLLRDLPVIVFSVGAGSVFMWYAGSTIVRTTLPQYSAAVLPFGVLCAALTPLAINAALAGTLWALGRPGIVLAIGVFDLAVLAVTMLMLVPGYGALGAAFSLVAGAIANLLAHCICVGVCVREYVSSIGQIEMHVRAQVSSKREARADEPR